MRTPKSHTHLCVLWDSQEKKGKGGAEKKKGKERKWLRKK
jgi:hypothetical protein